VVVAAHDWYCWSDRTQKSAADVEFVIVTLREKVRSDWTLGSWRAKDPGAAAVPGLTRWLTRSLSVPVCGVWGSCGIPTAAMPIDTAIMKIAIISLLRRFDSVGFSR
jgi:hypothetical protein